MLLVDLVRLVRAGWVLAREGVINALPLPEPRPFVVSALLVAAAAVRRRGTASRAERLTAADALSWGLISAVYPADEFDCEVDKVVETVLAGPAAALAKTKHAVNAATLTELDAALDREYVGQSTLLASHDFREGARAFQDRRTPKFTDA